MVQTQLPALLRPLQSLVVVVVVVVVVGGGDFDAVFVVVVVVAASVVVVVDVSDVVAVNVVSFLVHAVGVGVAGGRVCNFSSSFFLFALI